MTKTVASIWPTAKKRQIERWVVKWVKRLGLDHHHIDIIFSENFCPNSPKTLAEAKDNHPYESGHSITFYAEWLDTSGGSWRKGMEERAVVHELVHLITALSKELLARALIKESHVPWAEVRAADERMTDWLANIIFELGANRS